MMDLDAQARLHAIELLVAQLIAESFRHREDRAEAAGKALQHLLPIIGKLPLPDANLDEEATLRVRIQDAASRILKAAMTRLDET